jgi:hypothetical protein
MVRPGWPGRGWDAPHASGGVLVARRASRVVHTAAERPQRAAIYPPTGRKIAAMLVGLSPRAKSRLSTIQAVEPSRVTRECEPPC